MNIICHGCSFTKYKWSCWPSFLKWFSPEKVLNKGEMGSANETITRKTIQSVYENSPKHLYIMWSGTNRYEVWQDSGQMHTGGHPETEKHNYYVKHFLNEKQNMYRTLSNILFLQLFLKEKNVPYTMMVWKGDVITDQFKISKEIDWNKFIFYKGNKGLWEYAEENFKDYYIPGESHPPPIAHYHWVKDIMLKSDIEAPAEEYRKLKEWKI